MVIVINMHYVNEIVIFVLLLSSEITLHFVCYLKIIEQIELKRN